jgi:hypothetical protein
MAYPAFETIADLVACLRTELPDRLTRGQPRAFFIE